MEKKMWCLLGCLALTLPLVSATELGVNYYHESMMGWWGEQYVPRSLAQVNEDLDHIRQMSSHVKVYMNPLVAGNLEWIEQISAAARSKDFHVAVNMMVDDRQLSDENWGEYTSRVVEACSRLSGKVDSLLVGNELTLHSSWDMWEERRRIEPLIAQCQAVFPGEVSYEAFWYTKDAWYDYPGKIYFMFYENLDQFTTNVNEMKIRFGDNGLVGEFGEDIADEHLRYDHAWQRDQIEKRWRTIQDLNIPIAYAFAYRETTWDGFGLHFPDGTATPAWDYLEDVGRGQVQALAPTSSLVGGLSVSCTADCAPYSDEMSGACRTVQYLTALGRVRVQACDVGGEVELTTERAPDGAQYRVCFADGCVSQGQDYLRFLPGSASAAAPVTGTVDGLTFSSPAGKKVWDESDGACRTVAFSSSGQIATAKACERGGGAYEMYLLSPPNGVSVCANGHCVGGQTGFLQFTA